MHADEALNHWAKAGLPSVTADFIEHVRRIVRRYDDHVSIVTEVAPALQALLSTDCPHPKCSCVSEEHYSRYPLHSDELGFQVLAIAWAPGQYTPIHDHDETWGVVGVYTGRIEVVDYLPQRDQGNLSLMTPLSPKTASQKEIAYIVKANDRHKVGNPADQNSVTIHVYGKALDAVCTWTHTRENWYERQAAQLPTSE